MPRNIQGGAQKPVKVISASDLEENGGRYMLESHVAQWIYYDPDNPVPIESGRTAGVVYPVTDSQIASGEFSVGGGAALPIALVNGDDSYHTNKIAIPVYPIEESTPIDPAIDDPTDIPGLIVWHDFESGTWQDAVDGTPASFGDPVGVWENLVGNGNLTATGTQRPILSVDGVSFDGDESGGGGDGDVMAATFTGTPPAAGFTMFVIVSSNVTGGASEASKLFVCDDAVEWMFRAPANVASTAIGSTAGSALALAGFGAVADQDYIYTCVFNSTGSAIRYNYEDYSTGDDDVSLPMSFGGYILAYGLFGVLRKQMKMKELLIYDRVLTLNERNQVVAYLNERLAIF